MSTAVITPSLAPRLRKEAELLERKIAELQSELSRLLVAETMSGEQQFDPQEAGRRLVEEMKAAEGGAWTGAELKERFDLNPAVLHRRRKEHRILYWRDAKHNFHYPKWQFTVTGALLPGMQEVLRIFKSQDEWRLMRYFLAPRQQLGGRRPLDLLRVTEVDTVVKHAQQHGQENTW